MKKQLFLLFVITTSILTKTTAQDKTTALCKGMYMQWGYNREWYSHSDIHFKMSNGNDFTVYDAKAADRGDFGAILESPIDISIPQYNVRIGFYLNRQHSQMVEINFDHSKYIVTDGQTLHVKGKIDGQLVDNDINITPLTFLHFEHTDGANWLHINYVIQKPIFKNKAKNKNILTSIWKAGAGVNIPKTDFTWRGDRLNNQFHIAGYNASLEAGVRYYPFKKIFLETTAKTGFVNYLNALTNTATTTGNSASHYFMYIEAIVTLGYDIDF
jgi:hypothetical protein